MILKLNCKFLGKESRTSKKGNQYNVVTVLQGVDTLTLMADVDINATFGTEFVALLDYDIRYKNLKLIGAENE